MTQHTSKPTTPAAFLAMIPQGAPFAVPSAGPCGSPDCADGWIHTPAGATRCPTCHAQTRTAHLAAQYARAGVEGTLYHLTWADVRIEHDSWRWVRAAGADIRSILADCVNIAMVGEKGRGKTQAGVLLAKDAIDAGHSALVVSWVEWVDEVQSDYTLRTKTQAQYIATLAAPDLLVLDDVGAGASAAGELERKLFTRVISARYNRRLPTVLTANRTRAQLEQDMGDRAFDRIAHACKWLVFDGPAYRAEVEQSRVKTTLNRIDQAARR